MQLQLKTISKHLITKAIGTAGGSGGAVVGKKLGLIHLTVFKDIDIAGMAETIIYAIVGAIVGFYVTKFLQWIHNKKKND